MIPMELWQSEEMRKRRENAYAKAVKEKPEVVWAGGGGAYDVKETTQTALHLYRVKDKYTVQVYMDPDGQTFIECDCLAGRPPVDDNTGLPSREAVPCFHAASVLLFIAEKEKEADGISVQTERVDG